MLLIFVHTFQISESQIRLLIVRLQSSNYKFLGRENSPLAQDKTENNVNRNR